MKSKLIEPLKKIYGNEENIVEKSYEHREIDKEYLLANKGKTRGSIRINRGFFDSVEERDKQRKEILKTKLP